MKCFGSFRKKYYILTATKLPYHGIRVEYTSVVRFQLFLRCVNKLIVLIPNRLSKIVYGFFIKSYEDFKPSYIYGKRNGTKNVVLKRQCGKSIDFFNRKNTITIEFVLNTPLPS